MPILDFNAQDHTPSGSFDPIPAGWYHVKIDDAEVRPTKDGKGTRLAVTYEVLEGDFVGRKVFSGFNIKNANPEAERISNEQLSALCYVTGVLNLSDENLQALYGVPFQIKVKVRDAANGYDASNDVSGFRDAQGRDAKDLVGLAAAAVAATPPPQAPVSAPTAPPPAPPPPPGTPAAVRPADPSHIAPDPQRPGKELWWSGAEWLPAPDAPPPPPSAPATPPPPPGAPSAPPSATGARPPWDKQG